MKEELYQGISKSAEGYAACLTSKKAKEEGMNIAVQWQDADSSSNAVTEYFPSAEVMICSGHAMPEELTRSCWKSCQRWSGIHLLFSKSI